MIERKVSNKPLGKMDMHRYLFLTSSWNALVKVKESVWDMDLLNYQNIEKMLLDVDVGKEDPESLGIKSKQTGGTPELLQSKGKGSQSKEWPTAMGNMCVKRLTARMYKENKGSQ